MSWQVINGPEGADKQGPLRFAWARTSDGRVWLAWGGACYLVDAATLQNALPSAGARPPAATSRLARGVLAHPHPHAHATGRPPAAAAARAAAATTARAANEVRAPTAGRVSAVKVAEGQKVAENEVLLVLEAMKVEVAVRAPQAGIVQRLACAQGSWVEAAQTLMGLV